MNNKEVLKMEFEKLSPYTAKYGNVFFAYDTLCEWSFSDYQATLLPVFDKKIVTKEMMAIFFAIKIENSLWFLGIEKKDWILFHHAVKNKEELQNSYTEIFPLELQQVIAEDFIKPYLEKLGQLLNSSIILLASYLNQFETISLSSSVLSCEINVKKNKEQCYQSLLHFFIPEEMASIHLLEKIKKILPNIPQTKTILEKQDILLPISFCIGETSITVRDFETLAEGDFILFDSFYGKNGIIKIYPHYSILMNNENFVFSEDTYLFCIIEDTSILVKEWIQKASEEDFMEENIKNEDVQKDISSTATIPTNLSDFGLVMHFELEQRMISLEELQSIKAGYTFALNVDLLAPVNLVVKGKTLGKGKIVDINGVFGVQVTEFYNK